MHLKLRQRVAVLWVACVSIAGAGHSDTPAPIDRFPDPQSLQSCDVRAGGSLRTAPVTPLLAGHVLTLEFRDADTGDPIAVRAAVFVSGGGPLAPDDPAGHLFQNTQGFSHFYCEGSATVTVPGGSVTVKSGRGFEYTPDIRTFAVDNDTTVVIELHRLFDARALGWYAADTHVHIAHPPVVYDVQPEQVITVMDAEGLDFVNVLEPESYFTGAPHPASTPEHLLYFSKEERNAHFSHLTLAGLKRWIPDQTCDVLNHVCARTLDCTIADMVHAQDPHALVIATHPFPTWNVGDVTPWPGGGVWRGMTIDLLAGCIDAVDLLCYSHQPPPSGVTDYLHALTLGFRVPPSAGTDASLGNGATLPAGGYRVYVRLPEGTPFSYEAWSEALRAGRSFVTNYPLVTEFDVGGAAPGDELEYTGGGVTGHVSVSCVKPIAAVEIVGPAGVLATLTPAAGSDARFLSADFTVDPAYGGWIVARVTGTGSGWHPIATNGLFAQTAPIYVDAAEASPAEVVGFEPLQLAALRYQQFTEDISKFFALAEFSPASQAAFDTLATNAVVYYKRAWPDRPNPFNMIFHDYSLPHGMPIVRTLTPLFRWHRATDPDPGDVITYTLRVDTSPDFANADEFAGMPDTAFTLPPDHALDEDVIYYWQVIATDETGLERVASPGFYLFLVDITLIGAGQHLPAAWDLLSAHPNPFNPVLNVAYSVPPDARPHALRVYDALGHRVRTLYAGRRAAGVYEAVWDGNGERGDAVASGVYFLRLEPDGVAPVTRKVVLIK